MAKLTSGAKTLTAMFLGSGVLHLLRPQIFEPMVPHVLPAKRELVYASGVAELAVAGALLHPATRAKASLAAVGLLLAVFPANVQMALDAHRAVTIKGPTASRRAARAAAVARLPLQLPLIRFARAAGR